LAPPRFAFGYAWRSRAVAEGEAWCPAKPAGRRRAAAGDEPHRGML